MGIKKKIRREKGGRQALSLRHKSKNYRFLKCMWGLGRPARLADPPDPVTDALHPCHGQQVVAGWPGSLAGELGQRLETAVLSDGGLNTHVFHTSFYSPFTQWNPTVPSHNHSRYSGNLIIVQFTAVIDV